MARNVAQPQRFSPSKMSFVMAAVGAVSVRVYFSTYHLWGAQHFATLAEERERALTGPIPTFSVGHIAYVTNAVLSSAAFLEASINEVFDDVVDNHPGYIEPLAVETKTLLAGLWGGVERWSILEKYDAALLCAGHPHFNPGQQPYQDAKLLIELRNRLMHARPETINTGDMDKLSRALSTRFEPSAIARNSANPYFPNHCLGAGCARWAARTAEI